MVDLGIADGDPLSVIGWGGLVILVPEAELGAPLVGAATTSSTMGML
jgi:hypothetical protein